MPVKPIEPRPMDRTTARRRGRRLLTTLSVAALGAGLFFVAPSAIAAPPAEAVDAIGARYDEAGGASLSARCAERAGCGRRGGALQDYAGGAIYYSADSGAKIMYGEILKKYRALGGPAELGFPTNDETDVADGVGKFSNFSEPGGAAIYWNPDSGAWLLKGKVLDAWRESGDVTGPFGYPSADIISADGVDTANFVGPEGTQIQWSPTAGLTTVPTALAASLPGFTASAPTTKGQCPCQLPQAHRPPARRRSTTPSNNNWLWWLLVPLALALLGGLFWLLGRRGRTVETADLRQPDLPRPDMRTPDLDAPNLAAPRVQARDEAGYTPPVQPAAPRPPAANFTAPEPPRPTVPPAPKVEARLPPPTIDTSPSRHARGERVDVEVGDAPPMEIKYEGSDSSRDIEITYENNAVGADQESYKDKSDLDDQPGGHRPPQT